MERTMAGKVKRDDTTPRLDSPRTRAKDCAARGQPYYLEVLNNLHLGYRRGKRRGVWVMRRWLGDAYSVETIALADDAEPADGARILTFDQAKLKAIARADEEAKATKGQPPRKRAKVAPLTVAAVVDSYLDYLDRETKSGHNSRVQANASILPRLGHIALRDLTKDILKNWLHDLAASPRKTRAGFAPAPATDEEKRRRRNSANRVFTILRGALNAAFEDERVDSDSAWKRVKPLKEANAARVRRFTAEEMRVLVGAAEGPFKSLLIAALHSGARYGELCRLTVGDFEPSSDSLLIRVSKSAKARHIVLTKEAAEFFRRLCAGRAAHEPMLTRADNSAWATGQQDRPMRLACKRAGVKHGGFHTLRHTYASHAVEAGVPLMVVAQNLGHADIGMLQKHYAHIADEHRREMIQGRMTPLNLDDSNVVALVRR
jgi:integrase